ncbi:unnamed protein product [Chondrus crispus]|uniref:Uncharacterized protein n=1 Tax=Chondrus crispus TaxID=2769 RepID=R7QFM9_CHOCR|nr:unnamed protein product [Chondrus crispus]CDF36884.1 unnamed protein product [Chondrus crispus]|eukprot:XP_005716703.1 unnamed protein product [Chondrus crispus]
MERDGVPDFVIHEAFAMGEHHVFSLYAAMRQTLINSGALWQCIAAHFKEGDLVADYISQSMDRASDTEWADALLVAFSGGNFDDLHMSIERSQYEVDKFIRIAAGAHVAGHVIPGEGKPSLLRAFTERKKHTVSICEYRSDEQFAATSTPAEVTSIGRLVCEDEFLFLEVSEGGEHRCINVAWNDVGFVITSNINDSVQMRHTVDLPTSRVALYAMMTCERLSLDRFDTRLLVETVVQMAESSQYLSLRGRVDSEETTRKEELGVDPEGKNVVNFDKLAQVVRNMESVLEEATHARLPQSAGRVTATFEELRQLQEGRGIEDLGLAAHCSSEAFATLSGRIKSVGWAQRKASSGKGMSILANTGWEEAKLVISQVLKNIGDRAATMFKKSRRAGVEIRQVESSANSGLLWFDRIFAGGTLTQKRREDLKNKVLRKTEPTRVNGEHEEVFYYPLIDTIFAITNREKVKRYRAKTVQMASYGGKESHPGVLAAVVKWLDHDKDDGNGRLMEVVLKRGQQGYDKLLDLLEPELATAIYNDVEASTTLKVSKLIQDCAKLPESFDKDWVVREVLSVCTVLGISYTVGSANCACFSKVIEGWQDVNSATKRVVEYDYPVPVNGATVHAKRRVLNAEVLHVMGTIASRRVGKLIVVTAREDIESVLQTPGRGDISETNTRFKQQSGGKILHLEVMTVPREYQGFGTDKVISGSYGIQGACQTSIGDHTQTVGATTQQP